MTREEQILSLKTKVLSIAKHFLKGLPKCVQLDDIIQVGWVGAIKAVDKFDSSKNVPLWGYAGIRIEGEIRDYLRLVDPLKREHRREVKDMGGVGPLTLVALNKDLNEFQMSIVDKYSLNDFVTLDADMDTLIILRRAKLSERSMRILREYYWNYKTMKEIGVDIGTQEGRVSQLHKSALEKCRAAIA